MGMKQPELKLREHGPDQEMGSWVMAGPCSAETEEQVMATARALKKVAGVKAYRAGIWKPRTRPNSFEGVGAAGLPWLKRVKREVGLPVAVEVARAEHVYEALTYGVDILWVGARTTVNPFSVQEIADALKGVDVPVWVKNPINPDLGLWIGALERLNKAGVKKLGAIHRGFSTQDNSQYRNSPKWELALDLKNQIPHLPIICDPSHMGGKRQYLSELAQKGLDLGMDGLMLESHVNPDQAWSDPAQQLKPEALNQLLNGLQHRNGNEMVNECEARLEALRGEIDYIDQELIEIIWRRNRVAEKIGEYKKANNVPILQVQRWKELLEDRIKKASGMGLNRAVIEDIYNRLHLHSIEAQAQS